MVQHDVALFAKAVVKEFQLKRLACDVRQWMDNQLEQFRIDSPPDCGFFAIGKQTQPDPLNIITGDQEGKKLICCRSERRRARPPCRPVSLAGVVAGQKIGVGASPDQRLPRVIQMLVEVADRLTRHLPTVKAVLEMCENALANIGVAADMKAVAGRLAGRESLSGFQFAVGETGCCPLRVESIERHPEVGAELDGVVCDVQRGVGAGGWGEYREVDAPLLKVFGWRLAVVRHPTFEIGMCDRGARHRRVGQAPLVDDFQVRQEIELS